jgi:hypothetical protein
LNNPEDFPCLYAWDDLSDDIVQFWSESLQKASMRGWLRAVAIGAAIFVAWFALGVLTFYDDPSIGLSHVI